MRDRIKSQTAGNRTDRLGRISLLMANTAQERASTSTPPDQPRASSHINDNHCVTHLQAWLVAGTSRQTIDNVSLLNVKSLVVSSVHTAPGHSQKKKISPRAAGCYYKDCALKPVKSVSCVTQLSCAQPVTSVKNVASNLPVGAKLQNFWQTWLDLGAGPKIVQILRVGYTLPFRTKSYKVSHCRKLVCQSPQEQLPVGGIAAAYRQERCRTGPQSDISRVFQPTVLVPKPNNKWRPILDLSKLNLFLKVEKFKMETPETIRTSLQQGEWVTSVDFKDAYFHIPIQEQCRKYLRFHVQGRTYQFKALPFGLCFTVLAKEVKLMAIHKGIRIHQYLDEWLVRARSHQTCLQHTQILGKMCQDLGWLVNVEKSELEPKQVFDFVGYQFDLRSGRVRPTPDRWQSLQEKIQGFLLLPACSVRQFMSLIGLLTATEKQVHLGRLHMRPIQWHLKNNWRVPESLEKIIPLPRSLHPHLQWWLEESNVLKGQPLPQFVSPVPDPLAVAVDALTLPWEDLDAYAFPPTVILGKVVEKLQDSPCKRIILIAPGWPNMPWFWDLVAMSSRVPLSLPNLPNLVTQPFNKIPHRNLTNLNLHAWLLEPQLSRSRASLKQWQQELRPLREGQPDQSMRQSGPFLQSGASLIRWTSGLPL